MSHEINLKSVRIRPEWRTDPLWITRNTDDLADNNASPEYLSEAYGLTQKLAEEIRKWDDEFQSIWDPSDPASAEFPSSETESRWLKQGQNLAKKLAEELGPNVRVSYYKKIIQAGTTDREQDDD